MALADLSLEHGVLKRLRRRECSQHVRDLRAALPHALRDLLLREVVGLHQKLVGARGVDRVEIGPLKVLDEGQLEAIADIVADDRRDGGLARDAGSEHAAMPRHELVAVAGAGYHYWLQYAMPADRGCELIDSRGVELRPRLLRVRDNPLERDLHRAD